MIRTLVALAVGVATFFIPAGYVNQVQVLALTVAIAAVADAAATKGVKGLALDTKTFDAKSIHDNTDAIANALDRALKTGRPSVDFLREK